MEKNIPEKHGWEKIGLGPQGSKEKELAKHQNLPGCVCFQSRRGQILTKTYNKSQIHLGNIVKWKILLPFVSFFPPIPVIYAKSPRH